MYNFNINLYTFAEISADAQAKAIEEHRRFLLDDMQPEDFISGDPEYDTPESLEEQYNNEYFYVLENDDPVIESIEANEYLFYESGAMAWIKYKFPNHETREMYVHHDGRDILLESIPFKTKPVSA